MDSRIGYRNRIHESPCERGLSGSRLSFREGNMWPQTARHKIRHIAVYLWNTACKVTCDYRKGPFYFSLLEGLKASLLGGSHFVLFWCSSEIHVAIKLLRVLHCCASQLQQKLPCSCRTRNTLHYSYVVCVCDRTQTQAVCPAVSPQPFWREPYLNWLSVANRTWATVTAVLTNLNLLV
jgi:hypothetical protein